MRTKQLLLIIILPLAITLACRSTAQINSGSPTPNQESGAVALATQTDIAETPVSNIGSTITSEKDGMPLVFVPVGEFTMGSVYDGNEQPVHQVYLNAYWIDQTEVTNAMYAQCVKENRCNLHSDTSSVTRSSYFGNPEFDNYPVIYVSWDEAVAYCEWAGRRLPTEAEWEKAARGEDGRIYPWGNESPNADLLNYNRNVHDTTEVGSYPNGSSPYGVLDMAGNVSEWVNDWYDEKYYSSSPSENPQGPTSGEDKVLRGGSWDDYYFDGDSTRSANRAWWNIFSSGSVYTGFRCARSN